MFGFFYCAARASVLGAEYALKEITKWVSVFKVFKLELVTMV